jgi:phosphatidylglycerophosphate synthase
MILSIYLLFFQDNQNYTSIQGMPRYIITIGALVFYWFSIMDCMDGTRARRLKCGSPLGRVVDESLDLVAYFQMANTVLWMILPGASGWVLVLGLANLPFHSIEIRFLITKKLVLSAGELGPIEVEFIFFTLLGLSGLYVYDDNFYFNSIGYTFGSQNEWLTSYTWAHLLGCLIGFIYLSFTVENFVASFQVDAMMTVYNYISPVFFVTLGLLHSQLPTFQTHT